MSQGEYPGPDSGELLFRVLVALVDKVDHIHADLVALRARAQIERPECYPLAAEGADAAEPPGPGQARRDE